LIAASDRPIAAPSANRSNRISPTLAEHVSADLGDRIEMILDSGPCRAGVESTVLDLTRTIPTILRPGPIKADQISEILGLQVLSLDETFGEDHARSSPGQSRVHYAPSKPLTLWLNQSPDFQALSDKNKAVFILGKHEGQPDHSLENLGQWAWIQDVTLAERELYASLHRWDQDPSVQEIHVVIGSTSAEWVAVLNRLSRAAWVIY
jgi:L-threonylcarbamoyladenylate synthase